MYVINDGPDPGADTVLNHHSLTPDPKMIKIGVFVKIVSIR